MIPGTNGATYGANGTIIAGPSGYTSNGIYGAVGTVIPGTNGATYGPNGTYVRGNSSIGPSYGTIG